MNPELSVIVPSIRPKNLNRLYESVQCAFRGDFEFIVISPYELPDELKGKGNIRYIQDWGSPVRAQQIGIVNAKGDYILWGGADDGYFFPDTVDIAIKSLQNEDYRTLVIGKYYEGSENPVMNSRKYYQLNSHDGSRSRYILNECLMFMVGVIPRKLLIEIGGLDCEKFEALPMAFCDISVRLSNYGAKSIFQEEVMFRCSHMPGHTGDHKPIHEAQINRDQPMFLKIYNDKNSLNRAYIDIDNWKKSPEKWAERFGK